MIKKLKDSLGTHNFPITSAQSKGCPQPSFFLTKDPKIIFKKYLRRNRITRTHKNQTYKEWRFLLRQEWEGKGFQSWPPVTKKQCASPQRYTYSRRTELNGIQIKLYTGVICLGESSLQTDEYLAQPCSHLQFSYGETEEVPVCMQISMWKSQFLLMRRVSSYLQTKTTTEQESLWNI